MAIVQSKANCDEHVKRIKKNISIKMLLEV